MRAGLTASTPLVPKAAYFARDASTHHRWHADVQVPPKIHLDLYADDQAAEVERLVGLGASRVEWQRMPADADFVILADPEGNRFCVIDKG